MLKAVDIPYSITALQLREYGLADVARHVIDTHLKPSCIALCGIL